MGVVAATPADDYDSLRPRRVGPGGRSRGGTAGRVGSRHAPSHSATLAGVHRAHTGEGELMNAPRDPASELDLLLMALVEGELSPVQQQHLSALLHDDPALQAKYRDYLLL